MGVRHGRARHVVEDDVMSQVGGRAVQARVLSRRGDHQAAEDLAREAVAIMGQTDYLDQHAGALVHLAHVLQEAGKPQEAIASAREAVALYDRKGATFFVERTQRLIDELEQSHLGLSCPGRARSGR